MKKSMLKCNKCGKEYSYGRKIHHECNQNFVNHGVIFGDSRKRYDWNCVTTGSSDLYQIEERIVANHVSNSKVSSLYVYE